MNNKSCAYCSECKSNLIKDEIALSKKMLGRKIENLYCLKCLAAILSCSEDDLHTKCEEFREQGCSLFI